MVSLYRGVERLDFKVRKLRCDLQFLQSCHNQNLIPNFLKFKLSNRNLQTSKVYRNCQKHLLSCEIKQKNKALKALEEKLKNCHGLLKEKVSWLDYNHLSELVIRTNSKTVARTEFVQKNKLRKLGFVADSVSPEKVIFNYSSKVLTDVENRALSNGLKYALYPRSLNFARHFLGFEKLYKVIQNLSLYDPSAKGFNFVKTSLRYLAFWSYYSHEKNPQSQNLEKEEHLALRNLAQDKGLVVTRPDKGNGVVLLNKSDYVEKMMDILNDVTKFKVISDNIFTLILKSEDKLNRLLRKLKESCVIDNEIFSNLFASGSRPGVMYGLPKVHKGNCPLRPILSAIGTFNYNLSKFLVPLIAPITTNEFTVSSSFNFAKEICEKNFGNCYMASLDVTSLFTNIPLRETVNICVNKLFDGQDLIGGFNKDQFNDLLNLAVQDNFFMFNDNYYKQCDGVGMGLPLGCSLANLFMCHFESIWLSNCPSSFKPIFYRRYIDDTFLVFRSPQHVPLFLDYFNKQHPNINFTSEVENNEKLPFLDIDVMRKDNCFETSLYRKPTFTGLTSKFSSFIPVSYKRNLILTLTTRAYHICSNYLQFDREIQFIRKLLHSNGFPYRFTDTYVGKALNKIIQGNISSVSTVPRQVIYFPIAFTGSRSLTLRKKLTSLLRDFYPQAVVRVIFKSSRTIGSMFRYKDVIPTKLASSVVYQYTCDSCKATYIGKTKRQLEVRIHEHLGKSVRTGRQISKPVHSAIRDHARNMDHPIKKENFSVLASSSFDMDLLILESIYQAVERPSIGGYESSVPLLCF